MFAETFNQDISSGDFFFDIDTAAEPDSVLGTHVFTVQNILTDFLYTVEPLEIPLTIVIICPSDGALYPAADVNVI